MSGLVFMKSKGTVYIFVGLILLHVVILGSYIFDNQSVFRNLHNDSIHRIGKACDFYAVYHAAVNFQNDISPYARNLDGVTPYFYPFRYLPIIAIAGNVFTILKPQLAYLIWAIILEALLAVLIIRFWKMEIDQRIRFWVIGSLLLSTPFFLEVFVGQFTFAAIALCFLALEGRLGKITFSIALLLKPLTMITLPALVFRRRFLWQAIIGFTAVMVLTIPYFLYFPEQADVFLNKNFKLLGGLDSGNFGFVYFLHLLSEDLHINSMLNNWTSVISAFRILLILAVVTMIIISRNGPVTIGVAALLLAHFISYQHVWEHHMSGVCIIGAFMLTVLHQSRKYRWTIMVSLVLLVFPTPSAIFDVAKDPEVWDPAVDWPRYASYIIVLWKVIPTIGLFFVSLMAMFRGTPKIPANR